MFAALLQIAMVLIPICLNTAWGAEVFCSHDLKVELQPEAHRLRGRDDIRVEGRKGGEISLLLSGKSNVRSVLINGKAAKYHFSSGKLNLSRIPETDGPLLISISYDAVFNDPVISEPVSFDNPGFGVTGSISEKGTFLLEDCGWYPRPEGCRQGFAVQVSAPRGIYAVTAGELIGHFDRDALSVSIWKIDPMGQGLSLSAGRYIVRSNKAGRVPIFTYFTSENDSLSNTYLNAAASHIEFYESLHGPYPFPKFAIVENFFPTGYGFPSYTLLGGSVLRLPFIPQTSLRHEIAHSWWGNGVLVDYASGNWCEGLTTYVADYLSKEISSDAEGKLYRRQILEEYATLVASGDDLPLQLFGSRSSPATRAVGYGKAAFVFHMIRQRLGDQLFWDCLRRIYKEKLFVKTSWDDFREFFVKFGGWDAGEAKVFFDQWIGRSGAPVLRLEGVQSRPARMGTKDSALFLTTGSILQSVPSYDLDITVALEISQSDRVDTKVRIKDGETAFSIRSSQAPARLVVDPCVNTFRLLYPEEIPATVNSLKGSRKLVAVLAEDGKTRAAFRLLLESLDQEDTPVMTEKQAKEKSSQGSDLLFFGLPGSENLESFLASAPEEVKRLMKEDGRRRMEEGGGAECLFLVFKGGNSGGGITALFLPASNASADSIITAARKITHYGKYSYLTFSGGVVREKRIWEIVHSPLEFDF